MYERLKACTSCAIMIGKAMSYQLFRTNPKVSLGDVSLNINYLGTTSCKTKHFLAFLLIL